jgi:hypothetical protein
MRGILIAMTVALATAPRPGSAAETVRLYAPGRLRAALTGVSREFWRDVLAR